MFRGKSQIPPISQKIRHAPPKSTSERNARNSPHLPPRAAVTPAHSHTTAPLCVFVDVPVHVPFRGPQWAIKRRPIANGRWSSNLYQISDVGISYQWACFNITGLSSSAMVGAENAARISAPSPLTTNQPPHPSHMILRRENPYARAVVSDHRQIRSGSLRRILADAGLNLEQFMELLGRLFPPPYHNRPERKMENGKRVSNKNRRTPNPQFPSPAPSLPQSLTHQGTGPEQLPDLCDRGR
jgi:hypothetical protein